MPAADCSGNIPRAVIDGPELLGAYPWTCQVLAYSLSDTDVDVLKPNVADFSLAFNGTVLHACREWPMLWSPKSIV